MAIQTVDLKVPGGDTPRSANTKINANFANTTHAASRLVGTNTGNVPVYTLINGLSGFGYGGKFSETKEWADNVPETGFYRSIDNSSALSPHKAWSTRLVHRFNDTSGFEMAGSTDAPRLAVRSLRNSTFSEWATVYTTFNTTIEDGTGYLVASSPVLKIQHDSFEKEHEAEQLDIDVQHLETGVYEITGTTGLRENDGWYLKPPKDINGNVLCICEATQDGDVITLKTYKKKFDFETVSIVADYEQPTDIPDGAEVMLRFNDLPAEPMPQEV